MMPLWIERSLTFASSLVECESEVGHDRHNDNVFDNDEATVNHAVANQTTIASFVTENNESEDVHTFDSIVSRGIGNIYLSLENTQVNEGEDNLRDDNSDLSADDTFRNSGL